MKIPPPPPTPPQSVFLPTALFPSAALAMRRVDSIGDRVINSTRHYVDFRCTAALRCAAPPCAHSLTRTPSGLCRDALYSRTTPPSI